ncbi:MAG: hypothetical protein AAF492_28440 [Verrucomicrobiota bacterium]
MKSFRTRISVAALLGILCLSSSRAEQLPVVEQAEIQPLAVHVKRLMEALDYVGRPLSDAEKAQLRQAMNHADEAEALRQIQTVLDPHCLAGVHINPESRVKVAPGPAPRNLVEQGWAISNRTA